MTKVTTAVRLERWSCKDQEYLTLHGPRGARQDVSLDGGAVEQIGAGLELLAALKIAVEQAESAPFTQSTAPYFHAILTAARAVIAKVEAQS